MGQKQMSHMDQFWVSENTSYTRSKMEEKNVHAGHYNWYFLYVAVYNCQKRHNKREIEVYLTNFWSYSGGVVMENDQRISYYLKYKN